MIQIHVIAIADVVVVVAVVVAHKMMQQRGKLARIQKIPRANQVKHHLQKVAIALLTAAVVAVAQPVKM
jgi:cell division protein ZapA (FtsZ GTPase activity inhibitor)